MSGVWFMYKLVISG